MNPADRECVERVQAGDQAALTELYDRYGALLHPLALRITGNSADADEALFEAWTQVVRRAVPFEPRRGVAGWLLSLVRARAMERRRAGAESNHSMEDSEGGPIEVSAERVDLADRAIEALGLLDDSERQVLELAFFEGLPQGEIAVRLQVSVHDVKRWTRQGLDRLQDSLQQDSLPLEEAA